MRCRTHARASFSPIRIRLPKSAIASARRRRVSYDALLLDDAEDDA